VNKVKVWLAPGDASKAQAYRELHRLLADARAESRPRPGGLTFREAVNRFLAATEAAVGRGEKKPVTVEGYRRFLLPAASDFGQHPVASLKPMHVTAWLDAPRETPWNSTTRNNAITAVKACLNWARREGLIPENPLRDMAKPPARVAEDDLTPAKAAKILDAAGDRAFREFVTVAFATGARPSELMRLEARHVDFATGVAVMEGKTTGRTRRPRVIHVGAVAELLAELARERPTGPLLLNAAGTPWTRHTLAHRFGRLRNRLGLGREATAKGFRHGFATDGLEGGVPLATMAELMGHTSTAMLERHYSKLGKRAEHLREAAAKVRPGQAGPSHPLDQQGGPVSAAAALTENHEAGKGLASDG
jgi:integrase